MDDVTLYVWEPVVSPHKADLIGSLAKTPGVREVWLIAQEDLPPERRAQGWAATLPDLARVELAPGTARVREIVEASPTNSVHIFSGLRRVPCIVAGLDAVQAAGLRFGLMTEPRVAEGAAGWARFAQSWLTEGRLRRRADFVLAIGRHGPPWFQSVGYRPERIFPFAYFLPDTSRPAGEERPPVAADVDATVTFLGRIERAKGIHLFVDAVGLLAHRVDVQVAGAGCETALVAAAADRAPMPFTFHGPVPMAEVPRLLSKTDILVLPSTTTDDGWGAVVGEALFAGAAVVASDRVGASICLDDDERGRVVRDLGGAEIAAAIDGLIDAGALTRDHRALRSRWARARLTGRAGADHLLAILRHVYDGGSRPPPFYG